MFTVFMDMRICEVAMEKPQIYDGEIQREMTDAEYADWLALNVEVQKYNDAQSAAQAARQSAIAKLSALGLTEAEISALLGQ